MINFNIVEDPIVTFEDLTTGRTQLFITKAINHKRSQETQAPIKCSFCGLGREEVKFIVAGYAGAICDDCIPLAVDLLDEYNKGKFK